jgi:hypothetical protein
MKIKCSFIYETKNYETFGNLKAENPKISRGKIERKFVDEIEHILNVHMDESDVISEVKAKIIERKDNG